MTLALILLLFGLALLGLPLFVAIGIITLYFFHLEGLDPQIIAIEINRLANMPVLVALPFFTFTGTLLAEGNGPRRLVDMARALLGWLPGGVAIVALVLCGAFTAFTGASSVTIVALGGLLLPLLKKNGASDSFALGLLTTGGSFGLLFPPSLAVILYAIVAQVPIEDLFKGALLPGFLLLSLLGGLAIIKGRGAAPTPGADTTPALEPAPSVRVALRSGIWDLILPIIVVFGIYSGRLTVVEASTVSAAWALMVQGLIHREISITKDLPRIIREAMVLVGAVLVILAVAQGLTSYLIDIQLPETLFAWVEPWLGSRLAFLLALNIFLLGVGCLMDLFSAVVVVVPLLLPLAALYNVDPIHLGVIFLANLELGYITPPVGLNLFIGSLRFRTGLITLYRATLPFLLVLLLGVLIITYVPALSLWWR